jgi:MYXO-CTERM domain-containing protein
MASPNRLFAASTLALAVTLSGVVASAHISIERGGTHNSRYPERDQKLGPCGRATGAHGDGPVYTYEPGQTITVRFKEVIPHPSYFRFAFDTDGDDGFKMPASIQPIDPTRACPYNAADQCGASDFYNTPEVLPNMDNIGRHLSNQLPPDGLWEFQVKLPDVECSKCTLQLIQVMEDVIHGAYNPAPGHPADTAYIEDNYRQCIDIVLKRGGAGTGGTGGTGGSGSGGTGGNGTPDPDGCTCRVGAAGPASTYPALFGMIGLTALALRRRRR